MEDIELYDEACALGDDSSASDRAMFDDDYGSEMGGGNTPSSESSEAVEAEAAKAEAAAEAASPEAAVVGGGGAEPLPDLAVVGKRITMDNGKDPGWTGTVIAVEDDMVIMAFDDRAWQFFCQLPCTV